MSEGKRELALKLARAVFARGDDLCESDKAQRIAFKGGKYPDAETDIGGLCEDALAAVLQSALERTD